MAENDEGYTRGSVHTCTSVLWLERAVFGEKLPAATNTLRF